LAALLCLTALSGRELSGLTSDDVLDLADGVDPTTSSSTPILRRSAAGRSAGWVVDTLLASSLVRPMPSTGWSGDG